MTDPDWAKDPSRRKAALLEWQKIVKSNKRKERGDSDSSDAVARERSMTIRPTPEYPGNQISSHQPVLPTTEYHDGQ